MKRFRVVAVVERQNADERRVAYSWKRTRALKRRLIEAHARVELPEAGQRQREIRLDQAGAVESRWGGSQFEKRPDQCSTADEQRERERCLGDHQSPSCAWCTTTGRRSGRLAQALARIPRKACERRRDAEPKAGCRRDADCEEEHHAIGPHTLDPGNTKLIGYCRGER